MGKTQGAGDDGGRGGELGPRCPVCGPERALTPVWGDPSSPATFWRCFRCNGVWAAVDHVSMAGEALRRDHPLLDVRLVRHRCRVCRESLLPGSEMCPDDHVQSIDCASCHAEMATVRVDEIVVDVCRPCQSAWFDEGELGIVVRKYGGRFPDHLTAPTGKPGSGTSREAASLGLAVMDILSLFAGLS